MPHSATDTIVALATPPGVGGIAVVRISGEAAAAVLTRIFRATNGEAVPNWPSHRLTYGRLIDGDQPLDEAMAVLMRAPKSYTREDVAELHCHGGVFMVQQALRLAEAAGARPAEPGEFTRRAFQNGRVDLAQAEAVMALIGAAGQRSARDALRQLSGGASRFVRETRAGITALLAGIEAALDFPDEVDEAEATAGLREAAAALAETLRQAGDERTGRLLQDGLHVVIAGRPNVGKSTLLNALLGEERAIVTAIPGTTRDALTERIVLDGAVIRLTDTAGLRTGEAVDQVEAIGIARAQTALAQADAQLIVIDASQPLSEEDRALLATPSPVPRLVVLSKGDLPAVLTAAAIAALAPQAQIIPIAAATGDGLAALQQALAELAGAHAPEAPLTRLRHIRAAGEAAAALEAAVAALDAGLPLDAAAIDLRAALHTLGAITGETLDEGVIDAVFATFCVGK